MRRLSLLLFVAGCAGTPAPEAAAPAPAPAPEVDPRAAACGGDDLFPAPPVPIGVPGPPIEGTVAEISLEGVQQLDAARLREAIAVGPGRVDAAAVAADLRRLLAIEGVEDVVVTAEGPSDALQLRYRVVEQPMRGEIFSNEQAEALAGAIAKRRFVDRDRIELARRAFVEELHQAGYRRAIATITAHAAAETTASGALDLCVQVERGPRATIRRWEIRGVDAISPEEQDALWVGRRGDDNQPGGLLDELLFENWLLRLTAAYYDRGYLEVEVGEPKIVLSEDGRHIDVAVEVTEGPVFRLGEVKVEGPAADEADRELAARLKKGDVVRRSLIVEVVESIRARHRARGERADVEPDIVLRRDEGRADVTLRVVSDASSR